MAWVLLLLLCWPVVAAPQARTGSKAAPPAAPVKFTIESLSIEGNRNYTREQILTVAGLKVGQTADKAAFEAAHRRLVNAGAFENVDFSFGPSANGKGYAVTFKVVEIEQIYPIQFEFMPVPEQELRGWLKRNDPLFTDKVPGTRSLLDRYVRLLEEYLASKNHKEKVVGKLTADSPEELYILFHPASSPPTIAQVGFVGNDVIPAGVLQTAIAGVAVGTVYREHRFRQLLDSSIRPLYEARGRVRVAFPKIAVEPARDVNGLLVTVAVEEGQSYDLGEVRVDGTLSMNQELVKVANLKVGDMADFKEVKAGLERVNARMRREGYMLAASSLDREINDAGKKVDLVIHVEPGPQFTFGKLYIKGLDLYGEAEIKRIWGLDEGKTFNADYPEYFLQRVREEGIFDKLGKTRSVVQTNEKTQTVDVTLIFQ